jgi:hypothetical protein
LAAGLHGRNRWRLPMLLVGILFAHGRRTVTSWLRAAGVSDDYRDYFYFLAGLGRKTESVGSRLFLLLLRTLPLPDRLLVVIDDSPTKRYGSKVEGAAIHHNPTPGPADQKYLHGPIWVTLSLAPRHPRWGAMALPLRAMLYVRRKTIPTIPKRRGWKFRTKLDLAARLLEWIAWLVKMAGKTLWVVVDGGYTKVPFLKRAAAAGVVVIGRLRKDAALRDLFSTDPNASVVEILEAFADRATIEQDFHDIKELWAWNRRHEALCNRGDSPWDDARRRPSHADRRKALRQYILRTELSTITAAWSLPHKILRLAQRLLTLAT